MYVLPRYVSDHLVLVREAESYTSDNLAGVAESTEDFHGDDAAVPSTRLY